MCVTTIKSHHYGPAVLSEEEKITGRTLERKRVQKSQEKSQVWVIYCPSSSLRIHGLFLAHPSYSCGECHRRKQKVKFVTGHLHRDAYLCTKCDRQIPCSHCVSRKVPELCKAYSPGKPDQDVHSRLARIESVLEAAVPQLWSQSDNSFNRGSTSPGLEDDVGIPEGNDNMTGVFYRGSWLGSSAVGSIASPIVLEQVNLISNTYSFVLIGFRLTILSIIWSLLSIQTLQPMEDYFLLLVKALELRGSTRLRITSTRSSRIAAFLPTRLPSYYKSYPQGT